jgi:hypothetical protein
MPPYAAVQLPAARWIGAGRRYASANQTPSPPVEPLPQSCTHRGARLGLNGARQRLGERRRPVTGD